MTENWLKQDLGLFLLKMKSRVNPLRTVEQPGKTAQKRWPLVLTALSFLGCDSFPLDN